MIPRIPPHFVKHLVNEKAGRATLMGPYDDLWTIVLRKKENGTYLHDGWPNFMTYHSLGNREFLLFQYHGSLRFTSEPCITENVSAGRRKRDRPRKNNVDPIERRLIEAGKDQIKLRQSESCKYAVDAAPKEKRKQGRPRKNNVDPIEFRLIEAEKDQINLHQLESCKYAPNAAPEEKRKRG
ncbi:B3 domain-containing protein Os01g0723500-like [Actinidia eriantha]|uniref:B3 domain-containing protein Os01g0723500-like n=1 Tax=Actinidia eriantha TaxID=165200 RepID=UPI00258DEAF4|nr:B3 domain-containing protein Os01g0723500-like [Actinidia eriantha]